MTDIWLYAFIGDDAGLGEWGPDNTEYFGVNKVPFGHSINLMKGVLSNA